MKKTSLLFLVLLGMILLFSFVAHEATAFAKDGDPVEGTASNQQIFAEPPSEEGLEEEEDEVMGISVTSPSAITAILGNVYLITGNEIEIEFDEEVLNDDDAQDFFTIKVDGTPVEWEFLSYFDFGPYEDRGGVVNVRLKDAMNVGKPRIQRRAVTLFANTQNEMGPAAAERITVEAYDMTKTAGFKPFYEEIQLGHMSQIEAWGATGSGNSTSDNFSGAIGKPRYTTNYLTKQLGEGINAMVGRAEYLNIPAVDAGLQAHVVGSDQSVYEIPAYRELYEHGVTDDTYTCTRIEGSVAKPIIVTTADEVMRHDSIAKDEDGMEPARLRDDYFDFGEDFLRLYYNFGIKEGSKLFPIGQFNDWDEYRYDLQLKKAYDKAMAEGKWSDTIMAENVENYYIYGAMIHFEMIPESADGSWEYDRFPVNTREELNDYDNDLYRALCGIHGRYNYFSGTPDQAGSFTSDSMKNSHPWFWRSQADNYLVDSNSQPAEREPLKIEHIRIISDKQIEVKFNREISTVSPAATASNWRVYKNGEQLNVDRVGGYAWRTVTLQVPTGTASRLDNGNPYGRAFSGFTQKDIDERKIDAGGWIANDQKPGKYPLEYGQFVSLEDAIEDWGAGPSGTIEVEYVGADIKDWDGNVLEKNVRQEADFLPYIGNAYRSPLTGFYVYADTVVDPDTIKAGAQMYDTELSNNQTITYDMSAGGEDFPDNPAAVVASNTPHNDADRNYVKALPINFGDSPVQYDRVGQRIADGSVLIGGGMQIIGGSHFGHHAAMQPTHRGQIGSSNFHVYLYVEGWGGPIFQADEVLILKDTQLSRYKNENLIFHEGGHGIDSFTNAGSYAQFVRFDTTAAWLTAVAPENGRRWWNQYNTEGAYLRNRDEHVSTGSTFWNGTMRESFLGINDGTWTPINTREELYRYDPYSFEVFKRMFFNGELGLYYHDEEGNPRVGDPNYRVLPEDWELLRDQYPEFSHWTSVDDLIAWGCTIPEIARSNPYTGEYNPLVNWISWNTPNVWDIGLIEDPAVPSNKFDFIGRDAYYPEDPSPTQSQTHPFFRTGGVQKPVRSSEIEALVRPVKCEIAVDSITMPRPVLVQFKLENYDGTITRNNAQSSFELKIDGQQTHFYFWDFEEDNGAAVVTLRLDWPVEEGAEIEIANVTLVSATPTASVKKINDNENLLTIKVSELYENGSEIVFTTTAVIKNNAEGTYEVGDYLVCVNTKGNTQIRSCYIVAEPK